MYLPSHDGIDRAVTAGVLVSAGMSGALRRSRKTTLDTAQIKIDRLHRLLQIMAEGRQKTGTICLEITQFRATSCKLLKPIVDTLTRNLITSASALPSHHQAQQATRQQDGRQPPHCRHHGSVLEREV